MAAALSLTSAGARVPLMVRFGVGPWKEASASTRRCGARATRSPPPRPPAGTASPLVGEPASASRAEAEADVILRREETAATRSLAQTAKVLAENPLLVRLKELEAYQELTGKVGQVHLVLGEGALQKLQIKA
ncbi:MAG: hypothetical protein AB1730_21010 [Myxococcota bacterium]